MQSTQMKCHELVLLTASPAGRDPQCAFDVTPFLSIWRLRSLYSYGFEMDQASVREVWLKREYTAPNHTLCP